MAQSDVGDAESADVGQATPQPQPDSDSGALAQPQERPDYDEREAGTSPTRKSMGPLEDDDPQPLDNLDDTADDTQQVEPPTDPE